MDFVSLFKVPVGMCSREPRKTLAMASATEPAVLSSRPADQKGMLISIAIKSAVRQENY